MYRFLGQGRGNGNTRRNIDLFLKNPLNKHIKDSFAACIKAVFLSRLGNFWKIFSEYSSIKKDTVDIASDIVPGPKCINSPIGAAQCTSAVEFVLCFLAEDKYLNLIYGFGSPVQKWQYFSLLFKKIEMRCKSYL